MTGRLRQGEAVFRNHVFSPFVAAGFWRASPAAAVAKSWWILMTQSGSFPPSIDALRKVHSRSAGGQLLI
jgi:hypothetical protein